MSTTRHPGASDHNLPSWQRITWQMLYGKPPGLGAGDHAHRPGVYARIASILASGASTMELLNAYGYSSSQVDNAKTWIKEREMEQ